MLMRTAAVLAAGFLIAGPSRAAATAVTGATPSTPASGGHCPAHWTADRLPVPPVPLPAEFYGQISSVAVLSPTDVWALLNRDDRNYVYHLTGGKWQESAYLNASDVDFNGQSIAAGSDTDVWVAGENVSGEVWHYNGSAWAELASPAEANGSSSAALGSGGILYLTGTSVYTGNSGVWSYDGAQWTDLMQPVPRSESDDALAVTQDGTVIAGGSGTGSNPPVLQERTGTVWRTISLPSVTFVSGITVVPGGTVYAVGGKSANQPVLIKQAPGSRSATMADVPAADPATPRQLTGVVVTGPDDLWLLGDYELQGGGESQPWITHFDGSHYLVANTPDLTSPGTDAISGGTALGAAVLAYGSTQETEASGNVFPVPALIAVCPVQVTRDAIVPSHHRTPIGSQMFWSVQATAGSRHELVAPQIFDSGPIGPGGSFAADLFAAATYAVRDTGTGATQTIRVPASVSPASGATSTVFTVTCASLQAPVGYAYRVLIQRPGSAGYTLLTTTSQPATTFLPYHGTGTYRFECAVQTPQGVTAPSPPAAISVS